MIALWTYARFPAQRPKSLTRALLHVVASFLVMKLGQAVIGTVSHSFPQPYATVLALLTITVPCLSYGFVSWIWLLARLPDLGGRPRGGHPADFRGHA
jgi:hypothetical protein